VVAQGVDTLIVLTVPTTPGEGAIVNVALMSGRIVNVPQEQAAYHAAEPGVIMETRSLASG
jgi:NAD(P)-dependent dehydrogenase (short-subunit alcohol dehydrogenase family)